MIRMIKSSAKISVKEDAVADWEKRGYRRMTDAEIAALPKRALKVAPMPTAPAAKAG
jgi:hypothetical protein